METKSGWTAALVILASAAGALPGAAWADERALPTQLSQKFRIDHDNPEASLPSAAERDRNPLEFGYLLQDLLERAEHARATNDLRGVIRYYRAVAAAVPDSPKPWVKLCEAYETAGDRERAVRACRFAIERRGVELQDYIRYVRLVLSKKEALAADERASLDAVLAHLDAQPEVGMVGHHLRCELGVKAKDIALLEACTAALRSVAPDDAKTVVFEWALAIEKGELDRAAGLADRAEQLGVVVDNVERMRRFAGGERRGMPIWAAAAVAVAGLIWLGWVLWMVRRRRPNVLRLTGNG